MLGRRVSLERGDRTPGVPKGYARMKKAILLVLLLATSASGARAQSPARSLPGAQPVHSVAGQGVHYVYMVRHGNYDRDTSATDDRVANGLSPLGHEQAKLIGARLAALPVKMSHFVSSEFLRAVQTADEMGRALKLIPTRDGALNECYPSSNDALSAARERPEGITACGAMATLLRPHPGPRHLRPARLSRQHHPLDTHAHRGLRHEELAQPGRRQLRADGHRGATGRDGSARDVQRCRTYPLGEADVEREGRVVVDGALIQTPPPSAPTPRTRGGSIDSGRGESAP